MPLGVVPAASQIPLPLDPHARIARIGADLTSGFTPLQLPGLQVWLDPATLVLNHGDAVASWASRVGSGAFAQATGNKQPLYQVNALNGRNTVLFDGSNDALVSGTLSPAFDSTAQLSVLAVIREPTHTGARAVGFSWAGGFSSNTDGAGLGYTSATAPSGFFRTSAGASNSAGGAVITANTWHAQAFTNDGGGIGPIAYLDGAKKNSSGAASGVPTTLNTITLGGAQSGASSFCNVEIAELLIGNVAWVAGDMARLWTDYIKPKFGL